mmetsp:Transcript_16154/g.38650  ORF Transcript_16154/g.38650 Transcript_16154/m.38650 type:complete len:312 (-) Transcript_16154:120-1055(-)
MVFAGADLAADKGEGAVQVCDCRRDRQAHQLGGNRRQPRTRAHRCGDDCGGRQWAVSRADTEPSRELLDGTRRRTATGDGFQAARGPGDAGACDVRAPAGDGLHDRRERHPARRQLRAARQGLQVRGRTVRRHPGKDGFVADVVSAAEEDQDPRQDHRVAGHTRGGPERSGGDRALVGRLRLPPGVSPQEGAGRVPGLLPQIPLAPIPQRRHTRHAFPAAVQQRAVGSLPGHEPPVGRGGRQGGARDGPHLGARLPLTCRTSVYHPSYSQSERGSLSAHPFPLVRDIQMPPRQRRDPAWDVVCGSDWISLL